MKRLAFIMMALLLALMPAAAQNYRIAPGSDAGSSTELS